MEYLNKLVTNGISSYFKELPVPKSLGEWLRLGAFFGTVGLIGYVTAQGIYATVPEEFLIKAHIPRRGKQFWCNKSIEKHRDKVNHTIDIEDIGEQAALCRCWKSATFPYCDKAHRAHNEETGDNAGPVYIKRNTKQSS